MNACAIEFPDKSFDVAIDKGKIISRQQLSNCCFFILSTYPEVLSFHHSNADSNIPNPSFFTIPPHLKALWIVYSVVKGLSRM